LEDYPVTRSRLLLTFVVVALALSLQVCGGGGNSGTDTGPTVPVPVPTPSPDPTPVEDLPLSASCAALSPGVRQEETTCSEGPPNFLDEMNDAVAEVRNSFPQYFDGTHVLNVGGYYVEIIRALDRMGLCADTGGEEVGVKRTDAYNDQFDILTAKNQYRTGEKIYRTTCTPAVIQRGGRPKEPVPEGCSLPQSTYVACGRPEPRYYQHVEDAVGQILKEDPELFDFNDTNPGTDWPRLRNATAYHDGVVEILRERGYCAFFDGEEIQLKRENEFSEHYDVNYKDQYVRRGNGIFRSACYPAAF
jgi:hypothetical protein